jgi:hypothetical protein
MDIKDYDKLMNVAIINFFTLGKNNTPLLFTNLDMKDKRHLACIHIAKMVYDIYSYNFYFSGKRIGYWKLNWKCKVKKWLKYQPKTIIMYKAVDVEDFISHIEKANNLPNGFAEIYDEYFKRYDR